MHRLRGSHLGSNVLRRWVNLDSNLSDVGRIWHGWFNLSLLFQKLLILHECNIIIASHSSLVTVAIHIPGRIWNLLHLKQRIWGQLILSFGVLVLLVQVLAVVFLGIHKPEILLTLLDERLRERFWCPRGNLFDHLLLCEELYKDVILEDARFPGPILEDHYAESILDTVVPLAAIDTSISPVHLSIALLDIALVVALIIATACPSELTLPMFHVLEILAFVRVGDFVRA